MAAPDISHGKAFERDLSSAFEKLSLAYACRWERVLDSGSAGNLVRNADSDFKLMVRAGAEAEDRQGRPFVLYIEAKASNQGIPFGRCFRSLVKKNQNASLQMVRRSGACAVVFFHNIPTARIEVWRGQDINANYPNFRKPMSEVPAFAMPDYLLPKFAEELVKNPAGYFSHIAEVCDETRFFL